MMTHYTFQQIKRALLKVDNIALFCRRHDIPDRTIRRIRLEDYQPGRTTLKVLSAALEADNLLRAPEAKPASKPATKKAAR